MICSVRNLAAVGAVMLSMCSESALAQTGQAQICFTDAVPMTVTGWNDNFTVSKFDPALGVLQSVEFALSADISGQSSFESLDSLPTTVSTSFAAVITVSRPMGGGAIVSVAPSQAFVTNVTAFDGTIDFMGTSGMTFPGISATAMAAATSPPPLSDLALFTGPSGLPGDIVLDVSAIGTSTGSGAGNLILQFMQSASASIEVCYNYDFDCDGNGISDLDELAMGAPDCNMNGLPDNCDVPPDCNSNGVPDECELMPDCNSNGIPDECELVPDCNSNGVPDECELIPDCNSNGVPDECELMPDCNSNGVPDECELVLDCNSNGVPDECELVPDCNSNGVPDVCELVPDCNSNGVPDECELAPDCNSNGVPDDCELAPDCNVNGVPDECELVPDCNSNGIPDDCELMPDCNVNGVPDECELVPDCNSNGVPDDCDVAMGGGSFDVDMNGIPDECEDDCNMNMVPDAFDISTMVSADLNMNGIPDECENDCNMNMVPDDFDILIGTSLDCNTDGLPDECQTSGSDCNFNGIPDDCDAVSSSPDTNMNGIPDECETSDSKCNGDGGDQMGCTDCPCMNNAPVGTIGGCLNSVGSSARIYMTGFPSVSNDTVTIRVTGGPPSTFGILFSSDQAQSIFPMSPCFGLGSGVQSPVFDGLRCLGGTVRRHPIRMSNADGEFGVTTAPWGPPGGPPQGLIARGQWAPGTETCWQVYYRDDATAVCMRGLNTTNAVRFTITP